MVGPISSSKSSTTPKIGMDVPPPATEAAAKSDAKQKTAAPSKSGVALPTDKATTAKKAAESGSEVKGSAGSAPAPKADQMRAKKKSGVEIQEEVVTAGSKSRPEADPIDRAMIDSSSAPPAAPGKMTFGNSPAEIATAQLTGQWAKMLGEGASKPGSAEFKAAREVHDTGKNYAAAQKDYNDTVQIKGQAVVNELESAKKSGALKKMDDAFNGSPVMETLQQYQKSSREAGIALKNLTDVATPDARAAADAVGSAEAKLKQLQLGDLKGAAEKNKAELADKIAKAKGLVDEGWELGKALAQSGLSASAGPLVDYASKKLGEMKETGIGMAEDYVKGKLTEMLAGPEMKQMAEVEAKIQAYDKAIKDAKYKGAEKELSGAKAALEARMGNLEVARDNYISKRTEQGEAVDKLKSLEDEYNKKNPGKKSEVFSKLQDYHSSVTDKAQTLAQASAAFQQTLQKPPFAGGNAKNPDAKEVLRQAEELLSFYSKAYTGADKDQKTMEALNLRDYAKDMAAWAAKEGETAKNTSAEISRGGPYGVTDAIVQGSLAAMGAKADKSKIQSPN